MILIPVLALSALIKLANPDVTLHVSRITSNISVALTGAEYTEVGLEYLSLPQLFQPSLPGQSAFGVVHGLQPGSLADLTLCSASLPSSTRKSSPTSRAVTHESGSPTHISSSVSRGAAPCVSSYQVPSSGLSSSLSSFSASDFYLHGSVNASLTLNSTSLPVYGPVWEWSPRDLIIWVPQPFCPVPVLRSDMSTRPPIHRCTPGSQDYYAHLMRLAMVKRAANVRRRLARREFVRQQKMVIESIRQRELAELMLVYRCELAWQPIALCFSALVVCYGLFIYAFCDVLVSDEEEKTISSAHSSSTYEPLESSTAPISQDRQNDSTPVDTQKETSVKAAVLFYKPKRRLPIPSFSPPVESRPHAPVLVKFYKPRRLCSPLPPRSPIVPIPSIQFELPSQLLEVITEDPLEEAPSLADNEVAEVEKELEVVRPEHDGEAQGGEVHCEEEQEDKPEALEHPSTPFTLSTSVRLVSEPSEPASKVAVVDLKDECLIQELEKEEKEKGKSREGGVQNEAIPLEKGHMEDNCNGVKADSSLHQLLEMLGQSSMAVASGSSTKRSGFSSKKDAQAVLERDEQEQRDRAWLEVLVREVLARKEAAREVKDLKGKGREKPCEEKPEEIRFKVVMEQVEALRMAEEVSQKECEREEELVASEKSEGREKAVKRKKGRGPTRQSSGGSGSGGGSGAPRRV